MSNVHPQEISAARLILHLAESLAVNPMSAPEFVKICNQSANDMRQFISDYAGASMFKSEEWQVRQVKANGKTSIYVTHACGIETCRVTILDGMDLDDIEAAAVATSRKTHGDI